MLVNTVASASTRCTLPTDSSAVRASNQRPSASKRGRYAAVGRPPRIAPRPMSRFGASHTSNTRRTSAVPPGTGGTPPDPAMAVPGAGAGSAPSSGSAPVPCIISATSMISGAISLTLMK
jgi:hypothetical protein